MVTSDSTLQRIIYNIEQDELVHIAMSLADFNSFTGHEQEIADFVLDWFGKNGLHPKKEEVENQRYNAIGLLRGTGGGPSLTFDGHLDILFETPIIEKAYVSEGLIYGNNIENMRAGIAAFLTAAKAVKQAGIKLKGDVVLATVVGEIGNCSVGQFQGPQNRAESYGTWYHLTHGGVTDYAVIADGSDYAIVRAQTGTTYVRITTKGDPKYTPYTKRAEKAENSQNAIIKMTKVIDTIENWARDYERKTIYRLQGGQVEPKVSINKIQADIPACIEGKGAEPFGLLESPKSCDLYVDVRTPPGKAPIEIKRELEELLRSLPFECELELIRSQRGYEGTGPKVDYLCSVIEGAYERVFQSKPPQPSPGVSSMWTNTNIYWEMGIPAVKWGLRDSVKYPGRTRVPIDGLLRAAKVYALIALEVCGQAGK